MGNSPKKQPETQYNNKIILKLRKRTIIVHHGYKMKLEISDVGIFPHGLDGLKLWQSSIIGARYSIINNGIFKDKDVLQLNSGVGICGLSIKKWTKAKSLLLTDFHEEVVQNIRRNCEKNQIKDIQVLKLDWKNPRQLPSTFDIIIGNDLLYAGCPYVELAQIFQKYLKVGGIGIIIMPERPNDNQKFLNHIKQMQFEVKRFKIADEEYEKGPLANKVESLVQFPLIGQLNFIVWHLTKKQSNSEKLVMKEENQQENIQQKNLNNKVEKTVNIVQQQSKSLQKTVETQKYELKGKQIPELKDKKIQEKSQQKAKDTQKNIQEKQISQYQQGKIDKKQQQLKQNDDVQKAQNINIEIKSQVQPISTITQNLQRAEDTQTVPQNQSKDIQGIEKQCQEVIQNKQLQPLQQSKQNIQINEENQDQKLIQNEKQKEILTSNDNNIQKLPQVHVQNSQDSVNAPIEQKNQNLNTEKNNNNQLQSQLNYQNQKVQEKFASEIENKAQQQDKIIEQENSKKQETQANTENDNQKDQNDNQKDQNDKQRSSVNQKQGQKMEDKTEGHKKKNKKKKR